MEDPAFIHAYEGASCLGLRVGKDIHWRAHVVCWAAEHAKKLSGDFVECGVAKGFLSKVIIDYIKFQEMEHKKYYLLDTFEGIPTQHLTESEKEKGWNVFEPSFLIVQKTFSSFHNVEIVKGVIPETLQKVDSSKIAFLHIDLNNITPEIAALEFFWEKLVPGALIVLDDYGHAGHEEQKKGHDEFSSKVNVPILALPTGQGLMIKV